MYINFTLHAAEQIKERKIKRIWIEETIAAPDRTTRVNHKFYVIKKLNGKTLKVVYVKEKYIKVVTS
mgnify:CR=1 FL=1